MKLFARDALLPAGWAKDVVLEIAPDGPLHALEVALSPPADAERAQGTPAQRRFVHDPDDFRRLVELLALLQSEHGPVLGIAPHSLRAVTPNQLQWLIGLTDNGLIRGPIHIHAAEQRREVDACVK